MEVLRYGENLETKEMDCITCESRLRYNMYDIKHTDLLRYKYIVCPVCGTHLTLEEGKSFVINVL